MANKPEYLVVGRILTAWGVKGEVKMEVLTDFPDRLLSLKTIYLGPEARPFRVEWARLHAAAAVIKLEGYDTPESTAKLRDLEVRVPLKEAAPLQQGQYYHHDIIGLRAVSDTGEPLGEVTEILETGANDVYLVLTPEGKELLLPAIQSVILKIDLEKGEMLVHLLEGM